MYFINLVTFYVSTKTTTPPTVINMEKSRESESAYLWPRNEFA